MKRLVAVFSILTMFLVLSTTIPVSASSWTSKRWALIVVGFNDIEGVSEFMPDAIYLRDVLKKYYSFSDSNIKFLNCPTKKNLRSAITGWLGDHSDDDDLILIFIVSHGGGLDENHGGRVDESGDELDGIDECIFILPSPSYTIKQYWDDEMKEDLANLNYWRLIFFLNTCKSENSTYDCYGGGFIRDLSAPGRIIITPCGETEKSQNYEISPGDGHRDSAGCFSRPFIDALNRSNNAFDEADNFDGRVSMWEAFWYAWKNDPYRISGEEHPQLDDNADGVPYSPYCADYPGGPGEGYLVVNTYLIPQWNTNDLDQNGVVDLADVMIPAIRFGAYIGSPNWNPLADVTNNGVVDIADAIIVANDFGEWTIPYPYWLGG